MQVLMNQPVSYGSGMASQKMMQVCNCYIGMFKIPHTDRVVYDRQNKQDCDEIMATNQMARDALPVHLRPAHFGNLKETSLSETIGLCNKRAKLFRDFNRRLEHAGGGSFWNLFTTKMKDVPNCDEQGNFQPFQCNRYRSQCWCVSRYGFEIPGSRQNQAGLFTFTNLQLNCYNHAQGQFDPLAPQSYETPPVSNVQKQQNFLGVFGAEMAPRQDQAEAAPLRDAFGRNVAFFGK